MLYFLKKMTRNGHFPRPRETDPYEAGHETKYEFSQSPTVDSATNGNIGSKNFDFGNLALITGWISTCRGFEKITFVPFFVPSENISAEVLS